MKVTLTLSVLLLSGCTTLGGLATDAALNAVGAGEGLSIDTEIVAGDKEQSLGKAGTDTKLEDVVVKDNASITSTTTGESTDIAGAETVNLNRGVEFWQAGLLGIVMLLLGLFLPQFQVKKK